MSLHERPQSKAPEPSDNTKKVFEHMGTMCGKRFINNSEVAEMRTALKRMTAEDLELARESGGTAFQIQGLIGEDHLFDSISFLESEQQNTCKRPIR